MYDVAIIGGGVVGCAIARQLAHYRVRTVLLEKQAEVAFGTTKTNSGIIHAGHHSTPDTLKGSLVVSGGDAFDRLCEDLHFGFRRIGELVVAQSAEEIPVIEELFSRGRSKGIHDLEMWDAQRLRREEPNLSHHLCAALFAPRAGVVNPYEFAFALIENAVANGVELRVDSPVVAISDGEDGGLCLHLGDGGAGGPMGGRVEARFVLNCAGVYADRIAALAGVQDFEILPRKGEEYMLDKRLKGLVRRLVFPVPTPASKGILIIPTFDGTLMVGPTAFDTDDREDLATTDLGADTVFDFVSQLCPSITRRDTIAEFAGLRAVSSSNDFIIGPTSRRGFINVAGIQSPGLTASPAIATLVCEILRSEGLVLEERGDFTPRVTGPVRFASLDVKEQQRLAAEDLRFGRVVCRCEMVTEGEIHHAIDHGARTLDGVKFRTRAGMGRCQGGFCTVRCMDILAQRLGLRLEEVTKRGSSSWIVVPRRSPAAVTHPSSSPQTLAED